MFGFLIPRDNRLPPAARPAVEELLARDLLALTGLPVLAPVVSPLVAPTVLAAPTPATGALQPTEAAIAPAVQAATAPVTALAPVPGSPTTAPLGTVTPLV